MADSILKKVKGVDVVVTDDGWFKANIAGSPVKNRSLSKLEALIVSACAENLEGNYIAMDYDGPRKVFNVRLQRQGGRYGGYKFVFNYTGKDDGNSNYIGSGQRLYKYSDDVMKELSDQHAENKALLARHRAEQEEIGARRRNYVATLQGLEANKMAGK